MSPQIDHMEALDALDTAYQLLCEFQITIDQSLEGDHPLVAPIDRWLTWYEKVSGTSANLSQAMIEGHPV
jgi:hypothetical protein